MTGPPDEYEPAVESALYLARAVLDYPTWTLGTVGRLARLVVAEHERRMAFECEDPYVCCIHARPGADS